MMRTILPDAMPDLLDVVRRDVPLRRTCATRGGEWHGPCPFCGGRDRFFVHPAQGFWYCRQCTPRGGTVATYLRMRGSPMNRFAFAPATPPEPEPAGPPPDTWQREARALVDACRDNLLSAQIGAPARRFLAERGITEETALAWALGYSTGRERFAGVPVPRGLVLPWFWDGILWGVRVRVAQPSTLDGKRYLSLRGSRCVGYLAGTVREGQPVVLVEGEFDALTIWQETIHGPDVGVLATGTAKRHLDRRETQILAHAGLVLVAYDADDAGDDAAEALLRTHDTTWRRLRVPRMKDANDFYRDGGVISAWIDAALAHAHWHATHSTPPAPAPSVWVPDDAILTDCPACGSDALSFRADGVPVCSRCGATMVRRAMEATRWC